MQKTSTHIIIDGCALPLDLYVQARTQAIALKKVQCIGVIYDEPPKPPRPTIHTDTEGLLDWIRTPSTFFKDLREGNHLRYLMGCTYEELRDCDCAMIIHITPNAESVGGLA